MKQPLPKGMEGKGGGYFQGGGGKKERGNEKGGEEIPSPKSK